MRRLLRKIMGKQSKNKKIPFRNIKYSNDGIASANALCPIKLKNYIGNTQNVHPKVLYFSDGFGNHKYWMAYTPFPYSRDVYENPCIAYSDDGYLWMNIPGNPLDDPHGVGYNSDTHLVYNNGLLECWWRYVGKNKSEETIYRSLSADGIVWSKKKQMQTTNVKSINTFLSPAIICEDNKYCIWVEHSAGIDYYEAMVTDPAKWIFIRRFELVYTDDGMPVKPWHLDVIKDGDTYVMLVMCRNGTGIDNNKVSLFITTSEDNVTYTAPEKIVGGNEEGWDKYMYRSSIVHDDVGYKIYYSAGSGGTKTIYRRRAVWGIGITESHSLSNFVAAIY